jgi:methionyl-tRNA formyltransferase
VRVVFAGTPDFAVPALQALIGHSRWCPMAVFTQPDRPAGRGRKLKFGPVKQVAVDAGIDVFQPRTLKTVESIAPLVEMQPDLLVTAAYGLLLPAAVLELPVHGCWNLHASLLPRWRGASPINQAVLAGDRETGISLMQMDEGLDTGPVIMKVATAIGQEETAGELHDRLAPLAADLLLKALEQLEAGSLPELKPQDGDLATHAPLIHKSDARLDWQKPAGQLARMVRGYHPWPVAFAELEGIEFRIHRARAVAANGGTPGTLVRDHAEREVIAVACGEGVLEILELQAAGRKRVTARDWLNAHPDWR